MNENFYWIFFAVIALSFLILIQIEENMSFWREVRYRRLFIPFVIFILLTVVLFLFDLKEKMFDEEGRKNILAEFHGLWFDLIFVIIGIGLYDQFREKKETRQRLLEELENYKYWRAPESTFQRISILKKLVNLFKHRVNLSGHLFENGSFAGIDIFRLDFKDVKLTNCSFSDSSLNEFQVSGCDFLKCDFKKLTFETKLIACTFEASKFDNCLFKNVDASTEDFRQCSFTSTIFSGCDLTASNFSGASFWGNFSFERSKIDKVILDGCTFWGISKDRLEAKFEQWFGKEVTDEMILERYIIRNIGDPIFRKYSVYGGRPNPQILAPSGCTLLKRNTNPFDDAIDLLSELPIFTGNK